MKYLFIEKHQLRYPVRPLCQALEVSPSGYYAWRKRQALPADPHRQALLEQIERIHQQSHRTYGSPRVHAQLRAEGFAVNRKRIARLMRAKGLVGRRKTRKVATTDSRHPYPVAPNHLNRDFQAEAPNEKWVADITYIPTREGWLYLAVVLDLYSRRAVGWSMMATLTADLVEEALKMALYERQPEAGLLHHSDRGSQYASDQIRQLLDAHHITVSMSRTANCYDNAVMESFFSTLKCEWVYFQDYRTRAEASRDIFAYIAGFYNRIRLHSTLGYLSPEQFEAQDGISP
jgi:transposase InsO family protein